MAKKKTLSEYQAAFKQLVREMEQDFGWDNKPAKRYMELFYQMLGK